jgi:hypothetical protein
VTDDIVARLRDCTCVPHGEICRAAADEIERLRRELGQVGDADSWVSQADAAHLDSLLNWCEFNAMDWHRALARLVNDRARLRGEVTRLRELSGDAGQLRAERDGARAEVCMLRTATSATAETVNQSMADYAESRRWKDLFREDS